MEKVALRFGCAKQSKNLKKVSIEYIPSCLKYVYFCYRASANTGTGGLNPMEVDGFLQVAKKLDSLGGNNLAGAFASLTGGGGKGKLPGVLFHGVTSQYS